MRKVYLVPNLITTGNMFCGFLSVVSSCQGEFKTAAWTLFLAAIFDSLDGRIARMARATSPFGVQYDSLSDLTSFGIAPGILLYQFALSSLGRAGLAFSFLFALCSALRLARFNVTASKLPKNFFQGLPTPMAANMVAFMVIFTLHRGADPLSKSGLMLALAIGLSMLMVSSLAFPSFKEFHWRSRGSFGIFFVGLLSVIVILMRPEVTLFAMGCLYILASLAWNLLVRMGWLTPVNNS
ncbi:MAG: CDP-diacylglycerol--serine O-phosphatidyltransferase, partial [Bdellovibrionales bacterium]|nr:CDP-diacylglycerol--serine O-phosphatidyltransferase [Bdellovibrionales bacterium]